jgi:hypothetical protein
VIERIDNNQIQNFLAKSTNQTGPAGSAPDEDAQLQVNYASFIDQAQQAPETDAAAVQRARQLLLSGQLDSSEIIHQAAENIINYGV